VNNVKLHFIIQVVEYDMHHDIYIRGIDRNLRLEKKLKLNS